MTDAHADRHAIEDLIVRYATAIDARDWNVLDRIFDADAILDYTASGGPRGARAEVVAWIAKGLSLFESSQHLITNTTVVCDGDEATSRALFFNPLVARNGNVMLVGGAYVDRLRRTPDGWRIVERVQELAWTHGLPKDR